MNGIEKEFDKLGRVVIPISFRKRLGIESNSKVIVSLEEGFIKIRSSIDGCAICGGALSANSKLPLCQKCIDEVKSSGE